jgi:2-oxo-4-hydroxy-4-carboxy-5-ureidoimidazoline decarboxylase
MAEAHQVLNSLDAQAAADALRRCCGSERWVAAMLKGRPFASTEELLRSAERNTQLLERDDHLQAFAQHPKIGEDLQALRQRFGSTLSLASREQAGVNAASEDTLRALRDGNRAYESRFGFIFIVCATGKSAEELLQVLKLRLSHAADEELQVAAAEQAKITRLRLAGLAT